MDRKSRDENVGEMAVTRRKTLASILKTVANTESGRDLKLTETMTEEDFRHVPMTSYKHFLPFICRIEAGEVNLMSNDKLRQIGTTSGTSGTISHLPMVARQAKLFFLHGVCRAYYAILTQVGFWGAARKSCKIMYEPKFTVTETGLKIGPNSSAPSNSKSAMVMYSSPLDVYMLPLDRHKDALYLHAFFALADGELGMLESNFIQSILELMRTVEQNFSQLTDDIERGKAKITPFRLAGGPDPTRAKELRLCVVNGFNQCALRFWPHLRLVLSCDTGAMAIYGAHLRQHYVGDELPIYSPFLAATEGLIGFNSSLRAKTYELCNEAIYVEFLKEDSDDNITTIENLEVEQTYELLLTTFSGLVRYRYGDVVRIEATSPRLLFSFSHRRGTILDLRGERTTEAQIYRTLRTLQRPTEELIREYCMVHHLALNDAIVRYYIFVELETQNASFLNDLDEAYQLCNKGYAYHRKSGAIETLKVHIVAQGTFARIYDYLRMNNYPANQLKIPRLETRAPVIELLRGSQMEM